MARAPDVNHLHFGSNMVDDRFECAASSFYVPFPSNTDPEVS